jgi:hypothetical protein
MVVLIGIFYVRLILGEEAFLTAKLGAPYRQYLSAVPRIVPRFGAGLPPSASKPRWMTAVLTEIMPIGVFLTFAIVSWTYDNQTMLLAVLISFVASMVVRGLMKTTIPTLVFLAVAPAAWGLFHLSIFRASLIGLGASVVVYALMPGTRNKASAQE